MLFKAPSDYHDSFLKAHEAGMLSAELARELARSAGLRNHIVHEYEEVDHAIVHSAIPKALSQFRMYVKQCVAYIESLTEDC
jgi:uncharacterized protein YutE (UPF0331/DUF86 family)